MIVKIQLTEQDVIDCTRYAAIRNYDNRKKGTTYTPRTDAKSICGDLDGMFVECGTTCWHRTPFKPSLYQADTHIGDVAQLQVKAITKPSYQLLIKENDKPEFQFVLGYFHNPTYEVWLLGWLWGWEGQQDEFWSPWLKTPSFAIPQELLHPMSTLRKEAQRELEIGLQNLAGYRPPRTPLLHDQGSKPPDLLEQCQ